MRNDWEIKTLEDGFMKDSSNLSINKLKDDEGDYPFYSAKGFVKNISFYHQEKSYLAIIKDGAGVGRVSLHPAKSSVVGTLQYLLPKEGFDLKFLYYYLLSVDFSKYFTGSTIPHIYFKDYKSEPFPVVALEEQKEIVEILDQAFESIEKAKANIEKNIENAKELHESRIYNLFRYSDWNKLKWGHVCDFIRGPFGGSLKKSMFVDSGYAVYEQKQAIHNDYGAIRYFVDEQKFFAMKRFEVLPGDLLMSCSGVTLGRISEVPEGAPRGIINQALLKLRTKKDLVLNKFIIYWIRSKVFQDLIFKFSGGAAQPNVPGVKILKEVIIPCPSIEDQKEIVETLDVLDNHIQSVLLVYKEGLDNLEELKKSILQKAFSGELTNKNKAA